ncbi:MAG: hypothetical protein JWM88_1908 [Verrucomicrobia bacterium]|nr:hypothetical protein [Verrucomicrobiota bacterium]
MQNLEPTAPSFQLSDVYYTLFRHKWKIILCSLAGFLAAFVYYKVEPPPYQSSAKLFIRYVITESKAIGPGRDNTETKSPDQRGETIINSELEILTSLDLAEDVAKNVGPEKVLAKINGGKNSNEAAAVIKGGLQVDVPRNSSVIHVTFSHPDPEIAQLVLREVVASYLKRHVEIHRAVGLVGDFLTQETDQLRTRLAQTEEELRKAMNKAGIFSLEDYKKTSGEQTAHIRQQIFDVQAELAERASILEAYTKRNSSSKPAPGSATAALPPEKMGEYRRTLSRLDLLRKREQELLTQFTEENARVKDVRAQIQESEAGKEKLETDYPALVSVGAVVASQANSPSPGASIDVQAEAARLTALQAKIKALNFQLDEIRADATKVDQLEISILELRRRKDLEEANYRYYSASLEQSRINEALGTGRVSNISPIETPTPPYIDWKKPGQILAGLAASGVVLGFAWAFAIEFFLDRSIRRPNDVEKTLRIPLFISIPKVKLPKKLRGPKNALSRALPAPAGAKAEAGANGSQSRAAMELANSPAESARLAPFYETLRDRLISYFESVNLRHKPKLVAVTGLGQDSGVTTIAAGLARSLSETGEGNVLLVDMTQGQGSAQHFYKGSPSVGIDELLDTRSDARVQSNLYVVGESSSSEQLAKGMPQRFSQLVPKLKTSDFDYIIFDMPPVNQISITPRLASFMDMVLMVIESEKTDRDIAQRATELLLKSKSHLGVVMNKTRSYIPGRLHQDKDFLLGS